MRFSIIAASALATLVIAAPTGKRAVQKRAIFPTVTYDEITIAGGQAGDAEAEALAVFEGFGLDQNNLAALDAADLEFLSDVNSACNDAEKGVYNPAVEAGGADADAIQAAKIKNKVLKLTATMLRLKAEEAQGTDTTAEQAAEQKKLDNNISQDVAAAGTATTAIPFDATINGSADGGAAAADAGDAASADDAAATDDAAADSEDAAASEDASADEEDAAATEDAAADEEDAAASEDAAADEEDAATADETDAKASKAATKASKAAAKDADN